MKVACFQGLGLGLLIRTLFACADLSGTVRACVCLCSQELLGRYDKDGNERIDFEEFCLMYGELVAWQVR